MFIMALSNSPILAQIRGEHLMEPTIHLSSQITMNRKKTLKTTIYGYIISDQDPMDIFGKYCGIRGNGLSL